MCVCVSSKVFRLGILFLLHWSREEGLGCVHWCIESRRVCVCVCVCACNGQVSCLRQLLLNVTQQQRYNFSSLIMRQDILDKLWVASNFVYCFWQDYPNELTKSLCVCVCASREGIGGCFETLFSPNLFDI